MSNIINKIKGNQNHNVVKWLTQIFSTASKLSNFCVLEMFKNHIGLCDKKYSK